MYLFVYHAILSKTGLTLLERMAGTTRLELATSAVTEHLDLEFQGLKGARRNAKAQQEREGNC